MRKLIALLASFIAMSVAGIDSRAQEEEGEGTLRFRLRRVVDESELPPPPPSNLGVPGDLPESAKATLAKAINAYKEAFSANKDRDRLLKGAIRQLKSACKSQELEKVPVAHFRLGAALNQLRNFKEATPALERAVELNEKFYEAWVLLAEIRSVSSSEESTLLAYDKCLALYPGYNRALKGKTEFLMRLGKYKEAQELAEKASELVRGEKDQDYLFQLAMQLEFENKGNGWRETFVFESPYYVVRSNVSEKFAKEMAGRLELIRKAYMIVFPTIRAPNRKYEVTIHSTKTQYHASGAPQMAAGHYSPLLKKLVLYKHDKEEDTLIVLHHEAFHQFLHEYLEQAPQWFNEGLGDYFAPFKYVQRGPQKWVMAQPNSWRLQHIKYGIRMGETPAPSELMQMTQQQMYSGDVGLHYAMAWSLIYFCLEEKSYMKILVRYFTALTEGKDSGTAYDESFGKIDMDDFEERWKKYTLHI